MGQFLEVVSLSGGRSLITGYTRAKRTRDWVAFLPESGSEFRFGGREELASLAGSKIASKFNFISINKPGLEPDGINRNEFEKSFRRQRRIEDAMATLKAIVPKGDRIHLLGYSEGAYLAPQVARLDSRVRSVAMIGGGTRGWLKEEINTASKAERSEYLKRIQDIYAHPHSLKRWNGFSYATWYSYRGDNTLKALRGLPIPTLAILGARDRVIDLKTTIVDLMLVSENQPIQVHIFGDCGHNFTKHWLQVSRVVGRFLADQA